MTFEQLDLLTTRQLKALLREESGGIGGITREILMMRGCQSVWFETKDYSRCPVYVQLLRNHVIKIDSGLGWYNVGSCDFERLESAFKATDATAKTGTCHTKQFPVTFLETEVNPGKTNNEIYRQMHMLLIRLSQALRSEGLIV